MNYIITFFLTVFAATAFAQDQKSQDTIDYASISSHPISIAEANGLDYAYLKKGSGKVILFLHGFPDLANTWDDVIDSLSNDYTCVAPFLTGYYPSDMATNQDYTRMRIAKDMAALMTELGVEEFIVVGQDWGASIAYNLANLYPKRVEKIVTIAIPHSKFIKPTLRVLYKARHFIAMRNEKSSQFVKKDNYAYLNKLYERWAPNWKESKAVGRRVKETLKMKGRFEAMIGYYWSFYENRKNKTQSALANKLPKVPLLVFFGRTDRAVVPKQFYKMKKELGDKMQLEEHKTAGHFLHREAPDFFLKKLKAFLLK